MTDLSTSSTRIPTYDEIGVRDPILKHRAAITAVVEVGYHLRSVRVLPEFRVKVTNGDPGAVETAIRLPSGFRDPEIEMKAKQTGEFEWLHPGWTHRQLNDVPALWPGAQVFAGRMEERWTDNPKPGVCRTEDMKWGADLARRVERQIADNILSSLYGHLRDDLGREVFPLPSDMIPRVGLRRGAASLIIRHPSTPHLGLSAAPDDGPAAPHSDLVSDLIPPGAMIVCEEAQAGLGVGARVTYSKFYYRLRLKVITHFRWAVTAPETFRLFSVA